MGELAERVVVTVIVAYQWRFWAILADKVRGNERSLRLAPLFFSSLSYKLKG